MRLHIDGTLPESGSESPWVFVFGSNLAGRHGAGAALAARQRFGATLGLGVGPQGRSYAIPTKDAQLRALPLERIAGHVADFLGYARAHPQRLFFVSRVGCGLAGHEDAQIAPFFADAPANCSFAKQWASLVERESLSPRHMHRCSSR